MYDGHDLVEHWSRGRRRIHVSRRALSRTDRIWAWLLGFRLDP
jgi:hypothetical protein